MTTEVPTPEETAAQRMWRIHNRTPLDSLTARILEVPDEYCDEPTAHGDNVCRIMRETYEEHKPKGFWARRRERQERSWYYTDTLMFKIYQRVFSLMNVPNYEERKAYKALLADKARLDHLEELMKERVITLNGSTPQNFRDAFPTGWAYVHIRDFGNIPHSETIRGAIDNSMVYQNQLHDGNPLGLIPMSTTGNHTDFRPVSTEAAES